MNFTRSAVLLSLGFLAGWLANGWLVNGAKVAPPYPGSRQPTLLSDESAGPQASVSGGQAPSPKHESGASGKLPQVVNAGPSALDQDSWQAKLDAASQYVSQFKAMIAAGDYEKAVLYYSRHSHLPEVEPLLHSVLRNSLQTFVANGQSEHFSGLADAWLSSYYSDTEILLLVAKQHRSAGYVQEALTVLQLALTYSDGSEKSASYKALQAFIQDTDSELSRDNDWLRLQVFYETLSSMGLENGEDRLRLAEIYLFNGDEQAGRSLLQALLSDGQLKSRAKNMLQRYAAQDSDFEPLNKRAQQFAASIAMKRFGSHYLLPLVASRGAKVELLLDTGASTTLLSREAFQRLGSASSIRYLGPRIFNTANGLSHGDAYSIDNVVFGPFELENIEVAVSDADFGGKFDGLLGMNILQRFAFQIDQVSSELMLNPR